MTSTQDLPRKLRLNSNSPGLQTEDYLKRDSFREMSSNKQHLRAHFRQ